MEKKPKILIFDIETSPCLGWFWRTGKQLIGYNQVREPGRIICLSYRFNHWPEGKVKNIKWTKKQCDRELVKRFSNVAKKADLLVGHNGDSFDIKWLNARLAYHRLPTLAYALTEDTLKQARREFNLPSYRLDFLCKYFGIDGKLSTHTGMWERVVFENDRESLKEMVAYCDQDVLILDKLYERLYPYVKHKINLAVYNEDARMCPECGTKNSGIKHGIHHTRTGKKQRYKCKACGRVYLKNGKNLVAGPGAYPR